MRGVGRGVAEITVTAEDGGGASAAQTFAATVTEPETAWYLPPASDRMRQGFVRVLNHSDAAGEATVTAIYDAGRTYAPLTLALEPREAAHFNAADLESGNAAEGLAGATGPGEGAWRVAIESETLDVEALAYVRAADGFLAGMNATAPMEDGALRIAVFNPGSNVEQTSLLRLVNPGADEAEATVAGTDDAGLSPGSPVRLTLPAGSSCTVDAAQLESGRGLACGPPQEGLGDGSGRWRLAVASQAHLVAMSLLSGPDGQLANVSGKAARDWEDIWHVHLLPAASDPFGRQGLVRVASRSTVGGAVTILAYDDSDARYGTLRLRVGAGGAAHFDSDDLELGNRAKGLAGRTGSGTGTWRLRMYSGRDIDVNAYVRTPDGFLAAMDATAPRTGPVSRVAFFNPAGNDRVVSVLRLVNASSREAQVWIDGTDDRGLRPGTTVRVRGARDRRRGADGGGTGVGGCGRDRVRRARRRDGQVAAAGGVDPRGRRHEPAVEFLGVPDEPVARRPRARARSSARGAPAAARDRDAGAPGRRRDPGPLAGGRRRPLRRGPAARRQPRRAPLPGTGAEHVVPLGEQPRGDVRDPRALGERGARARSVERGLERGRGRLNASALPDVRPAAKAAAARRGRGAARGRGRARAAKGRHRSHRFGWTSAAQGPKGRLAGLPERPAGRV